MIKACSCTHQGNGLKTATQLLFLSAQLCTFINIIFSLFLLDEDA